MTDNRYYVNSLGDLNLNLNIKKAVPVHVTELKRLREKVKL
jgi:hypothetical protein